MTNTTTTITPPPSTTSPRFTLELEFVLSLSNPYYLQHLATSYPHLFTSSSSSNNSAQKFSAYLTYLHTYWSLPQYAKFLTHAPAVLHTLKLLQEERFRREVIRPDVVEALLRGGGGGGQTVEEREVQDVGEGGVPVPVPAGEGNVDMERMDEGAG